MCICKKKFNFALFIFFQIEDFPLPELNGLIEVKIEYGGLNFADLYLRKGLMPDKKLPFVLGMEGVGIITAVGDDTKDLKVSI